MKTKRIPISEIADINPKTDLSGLNPESPVSFIPMADASENGKWTGNQVRSLKDVQNGYTAFAEGDILFAKITPCMENGKGAHARGLKNGVGFGSTEFHVVRAKGENHPRFLYHWLQSKPTRLKAVTFMGGSAGQQRVQQDFFRNFRVPWLAPEEQARVAHLLDTIDLSIDKAEAVIAKLKQVRAGLLHDLLRYGLDENGQIRDPIAHPEQFKDSPLGRIPKGWKFDLLLHFVPSTDYGISSSLGEKGHPVLRMNNLDNGEAELSDLKYSEAPIPDHLWLRPGDVLFNRTNSWEHVGRTGIWRGQIERATFASYLVRLNPRPDLLHSELLNLWLNWSVSQIAMRRFATPAVQQVNINPTSLRQMLAAFPGDLTEQLSIIEKIRQQDALVSSEQSELTKLRNIKSGLQDDLLTGRVRVPETLSPGADEP